MIKFIMITSKEREEAFRADLKELLAKHKASLEITDDGASYGMQRPIIEVTMMSEYDDNDHSQTAEFTQFCIHHYDTW
jgi:hypothetical protein